METRTKETLSFVILTTGGYICVNRDSHHHDINNENPYGWLTSTKAARGASKFNNEEVAIVLDRIPLKFKPQVQMLKVIETTIIEIKFSYEVHGADV